MCQKGMCCEVLNGISSRLGSVLALPVAATHMSDDVLRHGCVGGGHVAQVTSRRLVLLAVLMFWKGWKGDRACTIPVEASAPPFLSRGDHADGAAHGAASRGDGMTRISLAEGVVEFRGL